MAEPLNHIGFIIDGNRRWAKERRLPSSAGHQRGAKVLESLIEWLAETDIKYASFFIFSTENWNRPQEEVDFLMKLLLKEIGRLVEKAHQHNMRVAFAGRNEGVSAEIKKLLQESEQRTADNTGMTICFCFNYGGQWEIADAATKAIAAGETNLTPETFAKYLYHPEIPSLDYIVRTSGEQRFSSFQLWRAAYAEFYFMDKYFPDFEKSDLRLAIDEYYSRQRRFGR